MPRRAHIEAHNLGPLVRQLAEEGRGPTEIVHAVREATGRALSEASVRRWLRRHGFATRTSPEPRQRLAARPATPRCTCALMPPLPPGLAAATGLARMPCVQCFADAFRDGSQAYFTRVPVCLRA